MKRPLLLLTALLAIPPAAPAQDDDADLGRLLGERSFRENCLICHSAEMTTNQRLSADQWKAEMTKMIGWGAPVPEDQVETLTHWLIAEFPRGRTRAPAPLVPAETVLARVEQSKPTVAIDQPGGRGPSLYATHCANCHGPDAQGGDLGPNLVERPILMRDDDWRTVMLNGRNRMPGYEAALNQAALAELRAWLAGRTYTPRRP